MKRPTWTQRSIYYVATHCGRQLQIFRIRSRGRKRPVGYRVRVSGLGVLPGGYEFARTLAQAKRDAETWAESNLRPRNSGTPHPRNSQNPANAAQELAHA